MKVSDLRKYRKNVEALEAIERQLDNRFAADTVKGCHGAPDYAQTHRHIEGLIPCREVWELQAEKHKIEREQQSIEAYIIAIPDRRIYQALYLYCIEGLPKWETVAERMNEESPNALEVAVYRYLCEK